MPRGNHVTVRMAMLSIACALFIGQQACTPCNDLDGDGYGTPASPLCVNPAPDCDDNDAARNPGAPEGPFGDATCGDTIDNDCNLVADMDEPKCDEDDLNMTAEDFECILGWSQVPEPPPGVTYFCTNIRGHPPAATPGTRFIRRRASRVTPRQTRNGTSSAETAESTAATPCPPSSPTS